jgi:hypothetical protein
MKGVQGGFFLRKTTLHTLGLTFDYVVVGLELHPQRTLQHTSC